MLVLSRKTGEEIVIGSDIRVVINRISGNRVILGITAPPNVKIMRAELEPYSREFEDTNSPSSTVRLTGLNVENESSLTGVPNLPR